MYHNILVISLSNIGDVLLTLPVVGALREGFPKAQISILVGIKAVAVAKDNPMFSEVIIYDKHKGLKEKLAFIKKLRKKGYDLVIDLRHSLFPFFLGIKSYYPKFFQKTDFGEHRVKKHLRSLKKLGLNTQKIHFPFYISEIAQENIKRILGEKKDSELIVINPTAASQLKCWYIERFILLTKRIQEILNLQIVIIGGKEDREKCSKICQEISGSLNLAGQLNLQELAALLERAKIFVTNDSGPLHLASALGVPTLAIFGPTDPLKYGPLSSLNRVVRKDLPCSPCELAQCSREHQCLKLLSVDEVFFAFKKILNEERLAPKDSFSAN